MAENQPSAPKDRLPARAAQAIALSVAFYVLALAIAALLAYLPFAEVDCSGSSDVPSLGFLWFVAAAILWLLWPRSGKFEAPGPVITPQEQPELFALIDRVATAAGQARPSEVYLVRVLKAFVGARGGTFGFGGRRVMGIGLPAFHELTVSQLQGVLAHEFGHYRSGDLKLGPWIHKTRGSIARVIVGLSDSRSLMMSLLRLPFRWYGGFFVRFTQAIARHQELVADAVGAEIAGRDCYASALRAVHAAGPAYEVYWRSVVVPLLGSGFRLPLASGFTQFRSSPGLGEKIDSLVARISTKDETARQYDSHPPLAQRLTHIEGLSGVGGVLPEDPRRAIELLHDPDALEMRLLEVLAPSADAVRALKRIEWADGIARLSVETWRRLVARAAPILGDMTAATVPTDSAALVALGRRFPATLKADATAEEVAEAAVVAIAAAVSWHLVAVGWRLETPQGQPAVLRKEQVVLRPAFVLRGLVRGTAIPNEWLALHAAGGISSLPLVAAAKGIREDLAARSGST
jgi:heat shock protein HtpX